MNKSIMLAVLALVVTILFGGSVFFYAYTSSSSLSEDVNDVKADVENINTEITNISETLDKLSNGDEQPEEDGDEVVEEDSMEPRKVPEYAKDWSVFQNELIGFTVSYPDEFELVTGPGDVSDLPNSTSISFDGMVDSNVEYSGVHISIQAAPTDANGDSLSCKSDSECNTIQKAVLDVTNSSPIDTEIFDKDREGFKYSTENALYTQDNYNYAVYEDGNVWVISMTINNYQQDELADIETVFNNIIATLFITE